MKNYQILIIGGGTASFRKNIDSDLFYIGETSTDLTKNSIYYCNVEYGDLYNVKNNDGTFILEPKSNFISFREFNLDKLIDNQ